MIVEELVDQLEERVGVVVHHEVVGARQHDHLVVRDGLDLGADPLLVTAVGGDHQDRRGDVLDVIGEIGRHHLEDRVADRAAVRAGDRLDHRRHLPGGAGHRGERRAHAAGELVVAGVLPARAQRLGLVEIAR